MDDYPRSSLDHNIPLLVTLGLPHDPTDDVVLDGALKETAVLLRSELPTVDGHEAEALLKYIQDGDASDWPWNKQEGLRKYKFKIRTAGQVRVRA
jgi:trafficking protein particle complex subunit 11